MIKIIVVLSCLTLMMPRDVFGVSNECRKIDEYGAVYCEDQQARLDNFAFFLQEEPTSQGYVIVYGGSRKDSAGRGPRRWEARGRVDGIKDYLANVRGVKLENIITVDGGFREKWMVQLYICPRGAKVPAATPTVRRKDIRFQRGRVKGGGYFIFCG